MKIAIDIDGVVAGGRYKEWNWKDPETYKQIPPLVDPGFLWRLNCHLHDVFFVTGRSRNLHLITKQWSDKYLVGSAHIPIYHCTGQTNKPAFLRLLAPDIIIDDNPNVLLGARDEMSMEWSAHCILVHDPNFHTWEPPLTWLERDDNPGITVVLNLAEAVRVVEEMAHQAAALSDQRIA